MFGLVLEVRVWVRVRITRERFRVRIRVRFRVRRDKRQKKVTVCAPLATMPRISLTCFSRVST